MRNPNAALIPCHICNAEISRKAPKCPSCGTVTRYQAAAQRWSAVFILVLLGFALFAWYGLEQRKQAARNDANRALQRLNSAAKSAENALDAFNSP